MILNFGHTFAHAIEVKNKYSRTISHGEAVLSGMILATKLSLVKKICSHKTLELLMNIYKKIIFFILLKNIQKVSEIKKLFLI